MCHPHRPPPNHMLTPGHPLSACASFPGITDLMPVPHEPKHVVKISCMPLQVIKDLPMRNRHITEAHISITPCR